MLPLDEVQDELAEEGYSSVSICNSVVVHFAKHIGDIILHLEVDLKENKMKFDHPHLKMFYNLTSGWFQYMPDDFRRRERIFYLYCTACAELNETVFDLEKRFTEVVNGKQG